MISSYIEAIIIAIQQKEFLKITFVCIRALILFSRNACCYKHDKGNALV